jgi:hypothetical protein
VLRPVHAMQVAMLAYIQCLIRRTCCAFDLEILYTTPHSLAQLFEQKSNNGVVGSDQQILH